MQAVCVSVKSHVIQKIHVSHLLVEAKTWLCSSASLPTTLLFLLTKFQVYPLDNIVLNVLCLTLYVLN